MPGNADFHSQPTAARLEAACTALARLHLAWQSERMAPAPCPAVHRRLSRAHEWQDLVHLGWQPPRSGDAIDHLTNRAWELLGRHLPRTADRLTALAHENLPLQPCLCDVWHDHVLFEGDTVTGLIDFGAVKMDHVAVDLARLLGSMIGDDGSKRVAGLKAYRRLRPLSQQDETLVHVLDQTGTILALGSWLRWLCLEHKTFPNRQAVPRRLGELVERVERW